MTLIEVLVSLIILSIILGSMYIILLQALNNWEIGDTRAEIAQNARIALERMTKELRHAKAIDAITSNPDSISFWTDNNLDGDEDPLTDWNGDVDPGETITYKVLEDVSKGGYSLMRAIDADPTGEEFANYIQDNINDFQLSYWDSTGTEVLPDGEDADIKLIKIKLLIKKTVHDQEYSVSLIGSVHTRNM
ncbi:MAG: prepilin-type N-terminal cleavage/methylation domain-containing protein [Candidatus Omnitrophica bacterium]|nr:prepilin-type N-terminal cleavage/methylation domain-containing protein [Candidatus Omnitrophota bacterium]